MTSLRRNTAKADVHRENEYRKGVIIHKGDKKAPERTLSYIKSVVTETLAKAKNIIILLFP